MEIDVSDGKGLELANTFNGIENLQSDMQELQMELQKYQQRQEEIVGEIEEEHNIPDVSPEQWDFSQLDQVTGEGVIVIPEKGLEGQDEHPRG